MASARPGTLYFDLLCDDEFDSFQNLFSIADEARQSSPTASVESGVYSPQSPILLLDALQDRPVSAGKAIAKKAVRLRRQDS